MNITQLEAQNFFGANTIVLCPRCGMPCKEGGPPNPDARLMQRSTAARGGMCASCAFTEFVQSVETLMWGVEKQGVGIFRNPAVQKGFGELFQSGNADAKISEVNWEQVIAHWDLPMPKKPRRKRG